MAIAKYPTKIDDIRRTSEQLPTIIKDIEALFNQTFKLDLSLSYKLIVGTFGSTHSSHETINGKSTLQSRNYLPTSNT
jgi:hypothetical protein